jgi:hypothetical protein
MDFAFVAFSACVNCGTADFIRAEGPSPPIHFELTGPKQAAIDICPNHRKTSDSPQKRGVFC